MEDIQLPFLYPIFMFLVVGKAFLEESHRRYYVKIEPKPGSERILEPAWRTLLRIHFLIFYLFGNFWPPSSIFFWSSIFPVQGVICSQDKMENVSFRAFCCCCCCCWPAAGPNFAFSMFLYYLISSITGVCNIITHTHTHTHIYIYIYMRNHWYHSYSRAFLRHSRPPSGSRLTIELAGSKAGEGGRGEALKQGRAKKVYEWIWNMCSHTHYIISKQ